MDGLKVLRENNFSHLDVKVDNVFVNITLNANDEASEPILQLKVGDFGMAKENPTMMYGTHGCWYTPPEILANPIEAYDGEKADVFCSSFVLIFIFTTKRFSNKEQSYSKFYRDFIDNDKNLDTFWNYYGCTPS